jgi:hypothetical protein
MRQLPDAFEAIKKDHPAVLQAYEALAEAAHEARPLDERVRRLVKLGIAVGGRLEGAVKSHAAAWAAPERAAVTQPRTTTAPRRVMPSQRHLLCRLRVREDAKEEADHCRHGCVDGLRQPGADDRHLHYRSKRYGYAGWPHVSRGGFRGPGERSGRRAVHTTAVFAIRWRRGRPHGSPHGSPHNGPHRNPGA